MKTSWNDIHWIERYLLDQLDEEERRTFEAGLRANPLLRLNVQAQKKMMQLLRYYHRRKLRREAERARHRLFEDPAKAGFRQEITQLFKH
jgi:anti-sigma factor RsiW